MMSSILLSGRPLLSLMMIAFIGFLCPASTSHADQSEAVSSQELILVRGAAGLPEYDREFQLWSERWEDAAERGGIPVIRIGDTTSEESSAARSPDNASATSADGLNSDAETDLQRLSNAITIAGRKETAEPLWIVYIGHGTFDGRSAHWNLRGPDISAEGLQELCQSLRRPAAFIICASCSAPFLNALSGPDRVVVTATKDGNQIQYSRFGSAFSDAISGMDADINRDGQVSLLEAWLFASRRTADFYRTEGRLATEHSLLDDNGDGRGVRAEIYEGDEISEAAKTPEEIDGTRAAKWHFIRSDEEKRLSPEQRAQRDELESRLTALRRRRNDLPDTVYLEHLEQILIPLAELYQAGEARGDSEEP